MFPRIQLSTWPLDSEAKDIMPRLNRRILDTGGRGCTSRTFESGGVTEDDSEALSRTMILHCELTENRRFSGVVRAWEVLT